MAKSSSKNSHWPLTLLGGAVSLANLFVPLKLVRIFPPEAVGQYKIFFLYITFVPLFFLTAGLVSGLGFWSGQEERRQNAFRNSWTNLLMIALFALATGVVTYPGLLKWLSWQPLQLKLFIWSLFVQILSSFFEEGAIALGMVWTGAVFMSGFDLVRNMAMLGAAIHFQTIDAVLWANLLVVTAKVVLGVTLGWRLGFQRLNFNSELRAAISRYAFPVSLSALLALFITLGDQVFLSGVIKPAEFAMYTLGCLQLQPLTILEIAVNRVAIPRMSQAFATGESRQALRLLRDSTSEMSWLFIPSAAGLMIFAEPIVRLLFTQKYIAAAAFLQLYALRYVVLGLPLDQVARAKGDGKWILRWLTTFSLISVLAVFVFGKFFGAMGALIAMLTTQYLSRTVATVDVCRTEGWKVSELLPWRDWLRYISFTILGAAVAYAIRPVIMNGHTDGAAGLRWFLVGGAAFSVVYMAGTIGTFLRRYLDSSEKPQVLYLTQYLGLGGLERMILNLARGVKDEGKWAPAVLVYDSGSTPSKITLHGDFKKAGIEVIDMIKPAGTSLKLAFQIARLVVKRKIAIVHSHDMGALIYAVMAKFMTFGAIRIVHTQHSFIHLERSPRYKHYERIFSIFADELTTVSEALQTQYGTVGVDPARVEVIPNGVEFPEAPVKDAAARLALRRSLIAADSTLPSAVPALEKHIDRVWVLCMARIHPKKGQDRVLELWNALDAESKSRAALIFVGAETSSGALEVLTRRLAELDNPPEVILAGPTLDPASWLKASDVSVSGSEFEGMPLGPIEAVGSGLKVIVSDIPGHSMLPDVVERFPLGEESKGAGLVARVISASVIDGEKIRLDGWNSGESIRKSFGILGMVLRYERVYQQAL